jgi:hypothetical protein
MALARLSRRAWMAVTGGALLAAGSAAVVWKSGWPGEGRRTAAAGPPAPYVDHDGWMLTPADKQRLEQTRPPAVQSP